jgi:hypothetical protein
MILSDYEARAKAPFQTYKTLVKYIEKEFSFSYRYGKARSMRKVQFDKV